MSSYSTGFLVITVVKKSKKKLLKIYFLLLYQYYINYIMTRLITLESGDSII